MSGPTNVASSSGPLAWGSVQVRAPLWHTVLSLLRACLTIGSVFALRTWLVLGLEVGLGLRCGLGLGLGLGLGSETIGSVFALRTW